MKLLTREETVKALGLRSARALDHMLEKGCPPPRKGPRGSRRYDVDAIRRWREERAARTKPSRDLGQERARLARATRLLMRYKLGRLQAELVPRETFALLDARRQSSVRAAFAGLAGEAVRRGVPAAFEALLQALVEGALTQLAATRWDDGDGGTAGPGRAA